MRFNISSLKLPVVNAIALISLVSYFTRCDCQIEDHFIPLKSIDDVSISQDGKVIPTKLHVVDPWIRPPRGVGTQQAIGMPGDFNLYPNITTTSFDRIKFIMRPIAREGINTQRHGVYVITDKKIVQDYLDGKSEHPCGEPVYTEENICQVVEDQGLNATDCPSRVTLFPLLEIFGDSGEIDYTVSGLASLAESHGVVTGTGSKALAFDCPWIQGRNSDGTGRTSHCIGGMYLIVEVLAEANVIKSATSDGGKLTFPSLCWTAPVLMAAFLLSV